MTTISPSLLAADFLHLEDDLQALKDCSDIWLHLDVMDGHFVPNLTFGHDIIASIAKVTSHPLDAHFMVTNPDFYLESLSKHPLHNFTFHLETVADAPSFAKKVKTIYPSVGVSIKPGTPVESLTDELLRAVDLVLVMSVEPGFGGQSFMPSSLEKVKFLVEKKQSLSHDFVIQIDGGINDKTAPLAIQAGANNLVAGSAVFKNEKTQYQSVIQSLRGHTC